MAIIDFNAFIISFMTSTFLLPKKYLLTPKVTMISSKILSEFYTFHIEVFHPGPLPMV